MTIFLKYKNKSKAVRISYALIIMFLFFGSIQRAFSQNDFSSSFGNTFIHSNGNMTVFGEHEFDNSNESSQPGIIGTERIPELGYINFGPRLALLILIIMMILL